MPKEEGIELQEMHTCVGWEERLDDLADKFLMGKFGSASYVDKSTGTERYLIGQLEGMLKSKALELPDNRQEVLDKLRTRLSGVASHESGGVAIEFRRMEREEINALVSNIAEALRGKGLLDAASTGAVRRLGR